MTATTFRDAYGVLQRHADSLRNQREPNIDGLLKIVTESVSAYNACKERIDAVERALEQALGGAEAGSAGVVGSDEVSSTSDAVVTSVGQNRSSPLAPSQPDPARTDASNLENDDDDVPF